MPLREVKIDKGIPIPPIGKYRVREMGISDSFFIQGRKASGMGWFRTYWTKATGFKFRIKDDVQKHRRGVRIWRVK
jgi:hypothetical protein